MADFATVLRKTIDGLEDNTAETRARVYQRARDTIEAKLAAASSPEEIVARQKQLLEDAIATVEAEYQTPAASPPMEDDLDSFFKSLGPSEPQAPSPDDSEPQIETGPADENSPPETGESAWAEDALPQEADDSSATEYDDGRFEEPFLDDADKPAREAEASIADVEGPDPAEHEAETEEAAAPPPPRRRARRGGLVLTLLFGLVLVGAAAYAGWHYRDDLVSLAGLDESSDATVVQNDGNEAVDEPEGETVEAAAEDPAAASDNQQQAASSEENTKFTQRLTEDGEEVDEGPAGGEPSLGEGTSIATATQLEDGAPIENNGEARGEALAVGQRAIFYEERTSASEGSAQSGNVVWSIVEESPGDNLPPEPAIRAEATIPDKDLQLKMTIRRNVDQSLPASHIVELIFLTSDDFPGGSIDNVLRVAMKRSEQDTGSPLLGIPAKIADGFFLVALSDSQADLETNRTLMRRQSWLDIPIVYTSGRRALVTLEKGTAGTEVFDEAMQAWANASSG
ncbi:hypothetical protein [Chelativorans sp. YIM 93263]|uniref:hypothetical protein n=1 Tax=Chelativorans sp. YIM 93263 TaxID=2906648 RepID=UPI002379BD92|nr:hypothetical protein [Chelativorans sp. YIM 93263]